MGEFRELVEKEIKRSKVNENWWKVTVTVLQLVVTILTLLFQARALLRTAKRYNEVSRDVEGAISEVMEMKRKTVAAKKVDPPTVDAEYSQIA